jgi:uncharacterized membrane protein
VAFPEVVEGAFDEIARYGRSSVSVTCRLLEAVRNIGGCVARQEDRSALLREATVIAAGVREAFLSDTDRELIAQSHRAALQVLHAGPGDRLTSTAKAR